MHPIFQSMWEAEWDDAMPVGYIIDRDYLADGMEPSCVGVCSRGWSDTVDAAATLRFRLKDDDGEIYYGGRLVDDDECMSQDAALSFGMNDAGCTTIEVKRNDEWIQEIA